MLNIKEGSATHWALRVVGVLVLAVFIVYIPTQSETARIGQFASAFTLIIAAMSLNLVLGYTGQISIGHSAFFGIGGYTAAILIRDHGWSPGYTFYAAAIIAFIVGCLIAMPVLRIRGAYLALVTLAVAVLFPTLLRWKKLEWLTDGAKGIDSVKYDELPVWPILGELKGRDGRAVFAYWLGLLVLVITFVICRGLIKSRVGRSLIAIRDNETAAAVMGVNVTRTKVLIFGISASMCALAGVLSTLSTGVVTPDGQYVTLLGSIIFLLIGIYGVILIEETQPIHYLFAFTAFISILFFMFQHMSNNRYDIFLCSGNAIIFLLLILSIIFGQENTSERIIGYEIGFLVFFTIFYFILHFRSIL
jgi:branched-chain amino acid transport system permease protein